MELETEPDDYGTIPQQFLLFDEFPFNHFKDTDFHNDYVPFDHKKHEKEIIKNFVLHTGEGYATSCFTLKDQEVKLAFLESQKILILMKVLPLLI